MHHSRVVVDTSVLHAYIAHEDRLHLLAYRVLRALHPGSIVAPSIVVHELLWSLRKRYGAKKAAQMVSWLLHDLNINVEPVTFEDIEFALQDAKRYHDLLVVSVAKRLSLPLVTFDAEMIRAAKRYGVQLLALAGNTVRNIMGGR
jgi:predicted nucleic acid-binding protein